MIHIHKYGPWQDKILLKESYLPGFYNKEQIFVQVKRCTVCGRLKKAKV